MVTIRDVAKAAGVSTATVSRVLNNDCTYKMREETRENVWRAVAQTGYKTPAFKAEIGGKPSLGKRKIGCVLSVTKDKYKDPYFMSIFSGVEERLEEKGFVLDFLKTTFDLQDKEVIQQIFANPPTGLILMETLENRLFKRLRARVPICVGVDTLHEDIDNVGYDQFETGMAAVRFLLGKGHQRIAFIGGSGPSGELADNKRYLGYAAALFSAGLAPHPGWSCNCQWDEVLCIEQVKQMMQSDTPPSAIFAASDLMAIAVLSALYSMNISVPQQVAVIGLSNIELSQFSSPPLTTFDIPTKELGLLAVDLLERRLGGYSLSPQRILLPAKRVNRASV